jgi:hypothetical protein
LTRIFGIVDIYSAQITAIYEQLDKIRLDQRREKGGKGKRRALTRRVNLGRLSDETPFPSIYPIMLDPEWYRNYLAGRVDESIFTLANDPRGWKADDQDDIEED